jgi:hypothetical protein
MESKAMKGKPLVEVFYSDEPDPKDEFAWKGYWVKKMYEPGTELLEQDRVWIHRCWLETKARWVKEHRGHGI